MKYDVQIPDAVTDPKEISKLMKVNVDFLKKEISDHINKELQRFAAELNSIKYEGQME